MNNIWEDSIRACYEFAAENSDDLSNQNAAMINEQLIEV